MAKNSLQNIFSILFLLLAAFVFFNIIIFLTKGIFTVLGWLAPLFMLAALFINRKVVFQYGTFLWRTLWSKPLLGLLYGAGTFFLFPLVSVLLLLAAVGSKKMNRLFELAETKEEHTVDAEYEIVEEIDLELPEIEIKREKGSKYDELF